MALSALCLFDGYGGFELGLRLAGVDVRTVARVERDSHAAAVLVARMEETHLDQAPVWDDVTTFDGRPWHRRVDIVTAGFNCQPFSAAGQRRGVDDERWLWPHIARIVADVEPRYVFLENVPGLVQQGGLDRVCGDLARLGFDAEWGLLSAAAVGAPHRRQRFWLLAWRPVADNDDDGRLRIRQNPPSSRRLCEGHADRSGGAHVGHTGRTGRPENTGSASGDEGPDGWRQDRTDIAHSPGEDVADAENDRPVHTGQSPTGRQDAAGDRRRSWSRSTSAWPPGPDDRTGWQHWTEQGGPEPQIRRSTDGRPVGLAESLHLGGNGLVPRVAAEAFLQLANRAGLIDLG